MTNDAVTISRLCSVWIKRIKDGGSEDQRHYAGEFLRLLGWEHPMPCTPGDTARDLGAMPYVLRCPNRKTVLAHFLPPGAIETPSAFVRRGLDFCPVTRRLVDEAQDLNAQYLLITDFRAAWLYDTDAEAVLLTADTPEMINRDIVPALWHENVACGAMEELRRPPRSAVARQLREWSQHWIEHLMAETDLDEAAASLAVDRLTVIRFLFRHDVLRRTRSLLEDRFASLLSRVFQGERGGCGEGLVCLFHNMWLDWHMDIFQCQPSLDAVLRDDAVAGQLLEEFVLLSDDKFTIPTVLESFNWGEPAEKRRVRMVPEPDEEREHHLSRQSLETIDSCRIEVDLVDEGYRSVLHWFDRVVETYARLRLEFDQNAEAEVPKERDYDLFDWSQVHTQRACGDLLHYACKTGFGLYYQSPRQLRVSRLLLTLHIIESYAKARQVADIFPRLDQVLMARPRTLKKDSLLQPDRSACYVRVGRIIDDYEYYG